MNLKTLAFGVILFLGFWWMTKDIVSALLDFFIPFVLIFGVAYLILFQKPK